VKFRLMGEYPRMGSPLDGEVRGAPPPRADREAKTMVVSRETYAGLVKLAWQLHRFMASGTALDRDYRRPTAEYFLGLLARCELEMFVVLAPADGDPIPMPEAPTAAPGRRFAR